MTMPDARAIAALTGALLILGASACDLNDPDEIQNQANLALVRVQFFASSSSRTPVPGVRMIVEAPQQDQGGGGQQQRRYQGPDVIAISGENGLAEAYVFPGYQQEESGGTTTPPANPLDPLFPAPLIFADVRVVFVYQGAVVPFIEGLTINSGRLFDLGAVYLDEFGIVVD